MTDRGRRRRPHAALAGRVLATGLAAGSSIGIVGLLAKADLAAAADPAPATANGPFWAVGYVAGGTLAVQSTPPSIPSTTTTHAPATTTPAGPAPTAPSSAPTGGSSPGAPAPTSSGAPAPTAPPAPVVTAPPVTAPPVTAPPVTAPPVTAPPVTAPTSTGTGGS
jgi:hypothetical protein